MSLLSDPGDKGTMFCHQWYRKHELLRLEEFWEKFLWYYCTSKQDIDVAPSHQFPLPSDSGDLDAIYYTPLHRVCVSGHRCFVCNL